jgi:Tfp pilus assembly protein PilX
MNHSLSIKHQHGLVLLIAMIALVVLSLAAVALIRTVDSATMIAGNLNFKQSATSSGEAALITANLWLDTKHAVDPPVGLNVDDSTAGYYATMTSLTTARGLPSDKVLESLTADATWLAANSRVAFVAKPTCTAPQESKPYADGFTDCSGNSIRFVIERMCSLPGAASGALANPAQKCLFGPSIESGGSQQVCPAGGCPPSSTQASPMYRVTARSAGPKNTFGYIQSFVY